MLHTSSLGYHTFTLFCRLTWIEGKALLNDFYQCSEVYVIPDNKNQRRINSNEDFGHYLLSTRPKYFNVYYKKRHKGISWTLKLSTTSPGFLDDSMSCSVQVTINPKIFTGIKDYLAAANAQYLQAVETNFNLEAEKISPLLGNFGSYSLNRVDYCINFNLKELGIKCSSEQMMQLMKRSNIPSRFVEPTNYSDTSHRDITYKNSLYLINESVTINCYNKNYHLQTKFPDCPNIGESHHVIRFEVQCKYLKVYSMSKKIKNDLGLYDIALINEMLSDSVCMKVVGKYFDKIIGLGDYYTLESARRKIERMGFQSRKEDRLIDALNLVNRCRGITKAKATLQGVELADLKRSLRDLSDIGINPVTIPKEWNIKHIPNLMDAYDNKISKDSNQELRKQIELEAFEEYVYDSKKHKKKRK